MACCPCGFVFVFYVFVHRYGKGMCLGQLWWDASGLWFSKVHIDRNLTNTGQDVCSSKTRDLPLSLFLSYEQLNNADIKTKGMPTFVCVSYMGMVSLRNFHHLYSLFALPLEFLYATFSFESENSSLWEVMYQKRFFKAFE